MRKHISQFAINGRHMDDTSSYSKLEFYKIEDGECVYDHSFCRENGCSDGAAHPDFVLCGPCGGFYPPEKVEFTSQDEDAYLFCSH